MRHLLPELNGYELLQFLHHGKELRHIRFIFLTALAEVKDLVKGLELGADDYITKPFIDEELLSAIVRFSQKELQ